MKIVDECFLTIFHLSLSHLKMLTLLMCSFGLITREKVGYPLSFVAKYFNVYSRRIVIFR